MTTMSLPSVPVLVLLISSIGWGLTWLPLQYFEAYGLNGPVMVFIIFFSASLVMLPLMFRQRKSWYSQLHYIFLIGLFGGLANLLFQNALFYGDVVRVMILFYLLPIWSVFGGRLFLGETIDRIRWITLVSAVAGGFLILGGLQVLNSPPDWIDLMAIGSGFAFAMNNLVFRATPALPLASKVAAMFIGVVLLVGGYLIVADELPWPGQIEIIGYAALYGIAWLLLITLGTQWGVTHLQAGRAAIIIVMELVVAVLSVILILSRELTLSELVGAGLVIAAAIIEGFREEEVLVPRR